MSQATDSPGERARAGEPSSDRGASAATGARLEALSHTADVGFRVHAPSLAELFQGAARGLALMLTGESGVDGAPAAAEAETWSLERPDLERLLVAWLRELLHRAQSGGELVAESQVEMAGPAALRARVVWWPEESRPDLVREIKGVTYHGLRVEEREDGWHARVVLDV